MLPKFAQIVNRLYAFIYETKHSKSGLGLPSIVALVMTIDKSWTTISNRNSDAFLDGLFAFIKHCEPLLHPITRKIRCPCSRCCNRDDNFVTLKTLEVHISSHGFDQHYTTWKYHSEPILPLPPPVPHSPEHIDMDAFFEDISANNVPTPPTQTTGPQPAQTTGPNNEFEELLSRSTQKLYPGCDMTTLEFTTEISHIKALHKITDAGFNKILALLQKACPPSKGYNFPSSYYEIKKTYKKIGLGYESIHACINDCFLFWGSEENLKMPNCPVCKESRYKKKTKAGKLVAKKIVRYFPLTPRLQRMFNTKHIAKWMTWHATGQSKEKGKMNHPCDGRAWKYFDMMKPEFSGDARNVRLGLAADGFNPFGMMSQTYSMWPVILTTYNTPPWMCMKETSLMLTMLIPGPKSPAKDIDVYLQPLIKELQELWKGVWTKDAATGTHFQMKAALLWTINDFPARSSLSGWSGQGYYACPTCNEDTPSMAIKRKIIKNSIFWDLEYWPFLLLKNYLDVMHIEKNALEALLNTLLQNDKSKDTIKARQDLETLRVRKELWWMFPFERYMKKLKNYVRNKAKPEGSIAEGYVAEEALTFCSRYLKDDVETRFNRLGRNDDGLPEEEPKNSRQLDGLYLNNSPECRLHTSCLAVQSGVSTLGLDGEMYYGQLEEILELTYIGKRVRSHGGDAGVVHLDGPTARTAQCEIGYEEHGKIRVRSRRHPVQDRSKILDETEAGPQAFPDVYKSGGMDRILMQKIKSRRFMIVRDALNFEPLEQRRSRRKETALAFGKAVLYKTFYVDILTYQPPAPNPGESLPESYMLNMNRPCISYMQLDRKSSIFWSYNTWICAHFNIGRNHHHEPPCSSPSHHHQPPSHHPPSSSSQPPPSPLSATSGPHFPLHTPPTSPAAAASPKVVGPVQTTVFRYKAYANVQENDKGFVFEVKGGTKTKLYVDDLSDEFVVAEGELSFLFLSGFKGFKMASLWGECREVCMRLMLPEGCPESVTSDYLEYSVWRSVQGVAAQVSSVLATQVIAKGEAQGMVSKSIGIMLGIALANCIQASTPLALASFGAVTWIHMFCNLKSYQSIQLRTLNPYRASLVFGEYLPSGLVPSVKEVNDEEPFFPALPLLSLKPASKVIFFLNNGGFYVCGEDGGMVVFSSGLYANRLLGAEVMYYMYLVSVEVMDMYEMTC
ncbi:CACTA transposable element [Tanacetum coccineum]